MGANFINSILEESAAVLETWFEARELCNEDNGSLEIIMSILSNYTPQCIVEVHGMPITSLTEVNDMTPQNFADRFKAVRIATVDPTRATTHNKGIFNGIDAVVLATGNDFRAIEACDIRMPPFLHTKASALALYRMASSDLA